MIYLLKEPSPAACRPAPTWTDLPAPATRLTPWDLPLPAPWGTPSQLPMPHPTLLVYVPRFPITHPLVPAQRILRHLSLPLFPFVLTASLWPSQALLNGSSHFLTVEFWRSHLFVFHSTFQEVFQLLSYCPWNLFISANVPFNFQMFSLGLGMVL